MDGSIRLSAPERKALLLQARQATDHERRLRAHLLVLLADGWSWNVIVAVLFTSTSTINRWRKRYLAGGVPAVSNNTRTLCRLRVWTINQDSLNLPVSR